MARHPSMDWARAAAAGLLLWGGLFFSVVALGAVQSPSRARVWQQQCRQSLFCSLALGGEHATDALALLAGIWAGTLLRGGAAWWRVVRALLPFAPLLVGTSLGVGIVLLVATEPVPELLPGVVEPGHAWPRCESVWDLVLAVLGVPVLFGWSLSRHCIQWLYPLHVAWMAALCAVGVAALGAPLTRFVTPHMVVARGSSRQELEAVVDRRTDGPSESHLRLRARAASSSEPPDQGGAASSSPHRVQRWELRPRACQMLLLLAASVVLLFYRWASPSASFEASVMTLEVGTSVSAPALPRTSPSLASRGLPAFLGMMVALAPRREGQPSLMLQVGSSLAMGVLSLDDWWGVATWNASSPDWVQWAQLLFRPLYSVVLAVWLFALLPRLELLTVPRWSVAPLIGAWIIQPLLNAWIWNLEGSKESHPSFFAVVFVSVVVSVVSCALFWRFAPPELDSPVSMESSEPMDPPLSFPPLLLEDPALLPADKDFFLHWESDDWMVLRKKDPPTIVAEEKEDLSEETSSDEDTESSDDSETSDDDVDARLQAVAAIVSALWQDRSAPEEMAGICEQWQAATEASSQDVVAVIRLVIDEQDEEIV
jgi:hypothetical protein